MTLRAVAGGLLSVVLPTATAAAAPPDTLRLGIALETDTLDPHFHW